MTLHEILEEVRHVSCYCGATEDTPCACRTGGYHLARAVHAHSAHRISRQDLKDLIVDQDVLAGCTVVLDPEVAA
jgi:hypothetical protein